MNPTILVNQPNGTISWMELFALTSLISWITSCLLQF